MLLAETCLVINDRRTVIGVVADVRTQRLDEEAGGQVYLPMAERPEAYAAIVARGMGDTRAMLKALRDAVHAVDPMQPLYSLSSMDDVVAATIAPQRTNTVLLAVFGALALLLSAVGVYAVLSYGVARRTREIGIRVALGAQRREVVGLIVRQGATLAAAGIVIGLGAAIALGKVPRIAAVPRRPARPARLRRRRGGARNRGTRFDGHAGAARDAGTIRWRRCGRSDLRLRTAPITRLRRDGDPQDVRSQPAHKFDVRPAERLKPLPRLRCRSVIPFHAQ